MECMCIAIQRIPSRLLGSSWSIRAHSELAHANKFFFVFFFFFHNIIERRRLQGKDGRRGGGDTGDFPRTVCLETASKNEGGADFWGRAFADFIFGSLILHFFCINFIN